MAQRTGPDEPPIEPRVVFNRSDCPYGCGEMLPATFRWQVTLCRRCGRSMHRLGDAIDEEGRLLWPPASVPRPPEAGQPDVEVEYVVDEAEAVARRAATRHFGDASHDRACREQLLVLLIGLILVVVVLALIVYVVVSAISGS